MEVSPESVVCETRPTGTAIKKAASPMATPCLTAKVRFLRCLLFNFGVAHTAGSEAGQNIRNKHCALRSSRVSQQRTPRGGSPLSVASRCHQTRGWIAT